MCSRLLRPRWFSFVTHSAFGAILLAAVTADAETCWRGRPDCDRYFVTDATFGATLNKKRYESLESLFYRGDVGFMANLSHPHAIGGTLSLDTSFDDVRVGINGRYRWWVTRFWAIDVTPGVGIGSGGAAFSSHVSLSAGDWGGVDIGYDYIPDLAELHPNDDPTAHLLRAGLKVGAYPGLGVGSLLTALSALVIVAAGMASN